MRQSKENHKRRGTLCLAGLLAAVLLGSLTAKGAAAAPQCVIGDVVRLMDPTVTVIDGPGDPVAEQERWSELANAQLQGPLSVALGETTFDLEAVP